VEKKIMNELGEIDATYVALMKPTFATMRELVGGTTNGIAVVSIPYPGFFEEKGWTLNEFMGKLAVDRLRMLRDIKK
jgi:hypothetical protein